MLVEWRTGNLREEYLRLLPLAAAGDLDAAIRMKAICPAATIDIGRLKDARYRLAAAVREVDADAMAQVDGEIESLQTRIAEIESLRDSLADAESRRSDLLAVGNYKEVARRLLQSDMSGTGEHDPVAELIRREAHAAGVN